MMWYDLKKDGTIIKLPKNTFPSFPPSNRFHLNTKIRSYNISTVFLGLDHNWLSGSPLLFETMVFGDKEDNKYEYIRERYTSLKEAKIGHAKMVIYIEGLSGLLKKL